MSPESKSLPPSMPSRREMAEKIMEKPSAYKVCECCGSIAYKRVSVCPNCNAYRFDLSQEAVLEQVRLLISRDPLSIQKEDYL